MSFLLGKGAAAGSKKGGGGQGEAAEQMGERAGWGRLLFHLCVLHGGGFEFAVSGKRNRPRRSISAAAEFSVRIFAPRR